MFYAAFWIFGPWVTDRLGRLTARFSRHPAGLLAARRLSNDPRGSWRTVSGLVLAGAVAGFFGLVHFDFGSTSAGGQVAVALPDGSAGSATVQATADRARRLLSSAGITAHVSAQQQDGSTSGDADALLLVGQPGIVADVAGGRDQLDAAITALYGLVPGRTPYTTDVTEATNRTAAAEIGELGLGVLALSFLLAAASAGLTAAATILDRRRVYRMLHLAGTPRSVLNRARTYETLLPLSVLAGGTTACGAYAAFKFSALMGTTPDTTAVIRLGAFLLLGTATMLTAIAASRPLLRAVTTDPLQQAD